MVDNIGSNLCSAALPGGGFFPLHDDIENFLKECFELAGVPVSKQNVNWLEGIVDEKHLKPYRDFIHGHKEPHKAPGAIVPDLDTRFLPVKQPTDASGATKTAMFVGDVKTCWLNKSNYDGAVGKKEQRPVEKKAKIAKREYKAKLKDLDKKYASEIVGDGTNGVTGPFERSLNRIVTKNVVPLVIGWYGETNEGLDKLLMKLARIASNGPEAHGVSPLDNSDRRGGAYPIILQRMRRGLACLIARGQTRHLEGRIHYLRKTPDEAHNTWRAHRRDNTWNPSQYGRQRGFDKFIPEGYEGFEQFRSGKSYRVNLD